MNGGRGDRTTFFIFSANRSYSSNTSCSSGERSSPEGDSAEVESVFSIFLRGGLGLETLFLVSTSVDDT